MAADDAFSDLPDALVNDLLRQAMPLAERVSTHLARLKQLEDPMRRRIESAGLIARRTDLEPGREPSVVGIDGSYQVHRLTAFDLCAAAAVAVEGTVTEAQRYWQEPYHRMWVGSLAHSKDAINTLRGLMISMELELAVEAPHDLVLLDGSYIVLLIYLHQGLATFRDAPYPLGEEFWRRWTDQQILECFVALAQSDRAVAVPKFSGRNELSGFFTGIGLPPADGKTLATIVLAPDEYTRPLPIFRFDGEDSEFRFKEEYCSNERQRQINRLVEDLRVVFYKPYEWAPAVRLELPRPIYSSEARMWAVLEGVRRQLLNPAVTEPYPLFLADRMVKSLGAGVSVIEQAPDPAFVRYGGCISITTWLNAVGCRHRAVRCAPCRSHCTWVDPSLRSYVANAHALSLLGAQICNICASAGNSWQHKWFRPIDVEAARGEGGTR
jgi:hypothetical protein